MISGKKLLAASLISLAVAAISFGLVAAGLNQARYLVYASVLAGVVLGFVASFGSLLGKVEKDF